MKITHLILDTQNNCQQHFPGCLFSPFLAVYIHIESPGRKRLQLATMLWKIAPFQGKVMSSCCKGLTQVWASFSKISADCQIHQVCFLWRQGRTDTFYGAWTLLPSKACTVHLLWVVILSTDIILSGECTNPNISKAFLQLLYFRISQKCVYVNIVCMN